MKIIYTLHSLYKHTFLSFHFVLLLLWFFSLTTCLWLTVMMSFYTRLACDWLLWCLFTHDLPVTDCYDVFLHMTYLWLTVMTSFYRCVTRSHSVLFLLHVTIYRQYISSNNHLQWISTSTFQTWIYGCHDNDNINYIIHIMVTWSFDALQ